jgi:hypothetical protein
MAFVLTVTQTGSPARRPKRGFTFDELNVSDELPVIHIPRVRRCRKVQVRSERPPAFGAAEAERRSDG